MMIVSREDEADIIEALKQAGEEPQVIGLIMKEGPEGKVVIHE